MATFVRSRAQYGHLLSHAVADIMQRAGVELWYWGLELPYMRQYRRTAHAFDLKTHEFLPLWRRKALKRSKQSLEDFLHASAAAAPMPPIQRRPKAPPRTTASAGSSESVPGKVRVHGRPSRTPNLSA
jgi:hypothetical protein